MGDGDTGAHCSLCLSSLCTVQAELRPDLGTPAPGASMRGLEQQWKAAGRETLFCFLKLPAGTENTKSSLKKTERD